MSRARGSAQASGTALGAHGQQLGGIAGVHRRADRSADAVGGSAHGVVGEVRGALGHAHGRVADDGTDEGETLAAGGADRDVAVAKIARPHPGGAGGLADAAPRLVEVLERLAGGAARAHPWTLAASLGKTIPSSSAQVKMPDRRVTARFASTGV